MPTNAPLSAGTAMRALDFPCSQFNYAQETAANLNNSTYSATAGNPASVVEVAVRCMAPTSGKIGVCVSAGPRANSATPDRVFVSFRVLEGDPNNGTLIQTDEAKYGVSNAANADASDDYSYGGHFTIVGGLIPGTYYYFQMRHRGTLANSTADIAFRTILAIPLP